MAEVFKSIKKDLKRSLTEVQISLDQGFKASDVSILFCFHFLVISDSIRLRLGVTRILLKKREMN